MTTEMAATLKETRVPAELRCRLQCVMLGYTTIQLAAGLAALMPLHQQIQAACTGEDSLRDLSAQELQMFQEALATVKDPSVLLGAAYPLFDNLEQVKSSAEALADARLAKSLYLPLLQSDRQADAGGLHEKVTAMLVRLGNPENTVQADQGAYLNAVAEMDPSQCLAGVKSLLEGLKKITIAQDLQGQLALVGILYAPLMKVSKFAEAKDLHDYVQGVLNKAGCADDMKKDNDNFAAAVPPGMVEAMFTLFKRALVAGDAESADKWIANLTAIAPDSPRVAQAKKMLAKGIADKGER